ncbi:hypothetical protein XPA_000689 [Xanthoria parietina]
MFGGITTVYRVFRGWWPVCRLVWASNTNVSESRTGLTVGASELHVKVWDGVESYPAMTASLGRHHLIGPRSSSSNPRFRHGEAVFRPLKDPSSTTIWKTER